MKTRVFKLLFIFLLFTTCSAMEETPHPSPFVAMEGRPSVEFIASLKTIAPCTSVVVDVDKLNLDMHYNMALKCLNLSDVTIGDDGLTAAFEQIKYFIVLNKVESLVLENIGLTRIPYFVISFALTNESLRYVSLMHNDLGIVSHSPKYDQQVSYLVEEASMHSDDSQTGTSHASPQLSVSEPITPSAPRKLTRSSTGADIVVSVVDGLWGSIANDVQKVITEQNTASDAMRFYKKIILIDKHIPPITVINQTTLPVVMTTKKKVYYILERVCFVSLGMFVTLLPTLLPYLLENHKTDNGSN